MGELSVSEKKYDEILNAINYHSNLHTNEVQPKLEKAGLKKGDECSLEDAEQLLGNKLFVTLQQITSDIIQGVEEAIINLNNVGKKLSKLLKETYPDDTVLSISFPNNNQQ